MIYKLKIGSYIGRLPQVRNLVKMLTELKSIEGGHDWRKQVEKHIPFQAEE